MELSFLEIINILVKRLKFIIICTILCTLLFFAVNRYLIRPVYTVSIQMYVDQNNESDTADINELYYAQKVVTTYISFFQTKQFYKCVLSECGLNYKPEQLKKMTKIQDVNSTEIFQISVTSNSAEDTFLIARTMQKIIPESVKNIKNSAVISVVDSAEYPEKPSGPNILLNTLIGGLLGLLISVIISFLWEIIDVNVKNQEDLKKKYNIPLLGSIPEYNLNHQNKFFLINKIPFIRKFRRLKEYNESIVDESKFIINEAFYSLRTNLRFILRQEGCRKIIINSPLPGEGKSTICTNMAISITMSGAKVLLMDCDLRKGVLHNLLNLKSTPGISDILSGILNEKDVIQNTKYENLDVITMGTLPPNPTELLGSIQMEELIRRLEKLYDYIIFDSPPINVVSDALSLVKLADGIVLVVRENMTSHPNIANAVNRYHFLGANILGFVLNAASIKQSNRKKSQYHYYRKYSRKND